MLKLFKNKYKNRGKLRIHAQTAFALFALFLLPLLWVPGSAKALTAEEEYQKILREINELNNSISQKKSKEGNITDDINSLSSRIYQTQLEINAALQKISILNTNISKTKEQIKKQEQVLSVRKEQLGSLIKELYEYGEKSEFELMLTSKTFSEFANESEYLDQINQKIKEEADEVVRIKNELEIKARKLADDKKDIETSKQTMLAKQNDLSSQKYAQSYLLSQVQNDRKSDEKERSQNIARKGVLECIIYGGCEGDSSGEIVVTNKSPHFSQLDSRWSNTKYAPCWDCTIGNYGCLITSLAMVRTSFGKYTTPPAEVNYHDFTDNGLMQGWDFAGRPKKTVTGDWRAINKALGQGKPVIVGVKMYGSGYWSHYIVLFGINGDTYYANDPAFESGRSYSKSRIFAAYTY